MSKGSKPDLHDHSMLELRVRPAPSWCEGRADALKAIVTPEILVRHNLHAGDTCWLTKDGKRGGHVIIDKSSDKSMKSTVVQLSRFVQQNLEVTLGDLVTIARSTSPLPLARDVEFVELEGKSPLSATRPMLREEHHLWTLVLHQELLRMDFISPELSFDELTIAGQVRHFCVQSVNGSKGNGIYEVNKTTTARICDGRARTMNDTNVTMQISGDGLGGLSNQLGSINEFLRHQNSSSSRYVWSEAAPHKDRGVLIYGLAGTGKSLLLEKVALAGWEDVINLSKSGSSRISAKEISQAFSRALARQPSVIIIDNLDSIAPLSVDGVGSTSVGNASMLGQEMDALGEAKVVVFAATRKLTDVEPNLRNHRRFSIEIEIPVPDLVTRSAILKVLSGAKLDDANPKFESVASRTHGFVGGDLVRLRQLAAKYAISRVESSSRSSTGTKKSSDTFDSEHSNEAKTLECKEEDYSQALQQVRPTAIREIFVETPRVRWTDIAGQEDVKRYLEEALIWPYKYPSELASYGIEPRRGLLLYGPPGCSKTMMAKAAATESGLNFIAVRGAELLNMYVGETERAIRDTFAKARAASPCIIFFDEIDALGSSRGDSHASVNSVTTLLNELDGIEDTLGNVFVLAATNRPQALDPALTRPGRLDGMLYVGPPDSEARLQILLKRAEKIKKLDDSVDFVSLAKSEDMQGRSGAEVVTVVQQAAMLAFREHITGRQLEANADVSVTMDHFRRAAELVGRNITPDMLARFSDFAAGRGLHFGV